MGEQRIVGVGLHVADLERSVDFYTDVVGMKELARYEFDGLTEVMVGYPTGDGAPSLILVDRADNPGPHDVGNGFDRVMLMVDDVDAVCDRLRAFGCTVITEPAPMHQFPVKLAMAQDPDGYRLELLESRES